MTSKKSFDLYTIAKRGDVLQLQTRLNLAIDRNAHHKLSPHFTPLIVAIVRGQTRMVIQLLMFGVDVHRKNGGEIRTKKIKKFGKWRITTNEEYYEDFPLIYSPIEWAIRQGRFNLVPILLEAGAKMPTDEWFIYTLYTNIVSIKYARDALWYVTHMTERIYRMIDRENKNLLITQCFRASIGTYLIYIPRDVWQSILVYVGFY